MSTQTISSSLLRQGVYKHALTLIAQSGLSSRCFALCAHFDSKAIQRRGGGCILIHFPGAFGLQFTLIHC